MRPTSDYVGKNIDRATIDMVGTFFCLSFDEVIQASELLYDYMQKEFSEECVLHVTQDDRVIKKRTAIREKALKNDTSVLFDVEGYVKGKNVYNKTSYYAYDRALGLRCCGRSEDYYQYMRDNVFPLVGSDEAYLQAVYQLYDEEDRHNICPFIRPDVHLSVFASHCPRSHPDYPKANDLYFGDIMVSVSVFSLEDDADSFADKLYEFALSLSETIRNVNITIGRHQNFSPMGCRIDPGFCEFPPEIQDEEEQLVLQFLSEYMYLPDIGWRIILCSHTGNLLQSEKNAEAFPDISMDDVQGRIIVKHHKRLMDLTIADAKNMKRQVYSALRPTVEHRIPYHHNFRWAWEIQPKLEGELSIEKHEVTFRHLGKVNLDFLRKGLADS